MGFGFGDNTSGVDAVSDDAFEVQDAGLYAEDFSAVDDPAVDAFEVEVEVEGEGEGQHVE